MSDTKIPIEYIPEEELLSEFISKESAALLLKEYSGVDQILLHLSDQRIAKIQGLGSAKLRKLLCIRELLNRLQQAKGKKLTRINSAVDVVESFIFLEDKRQEELWVLLLNSKNAILQKKCITIGTVNASLAAPREIFHAAIEQLAAGVIVVHNHPSGDPTPSKEDCHITQCLLEAGKLLNIALLDHVIIGKQNYYSLREAQPEMWRK